jgi:serine/threonine protein kinase
MEGKMWINWFVFCIVSGVASSQLRLQLWEVAQGLEYLHSRNIVHGDLRGVG